MGVFDFSAGKYPRIKKGGPFFGPPSLPLPALAYLPGIPSQKIFPLGFVRPATVLHGVQTALQPDPSAAN